MFKIYGTSSCSFCKKAVELLEEKDMPFEYVALSDTTISEQTKLMGIAGVAFQTVPQIFVELEAGTKYVGGYAELKKRLS